MLFKVSVWVDPIISKSNFKNKSQNYLFKMK